MTIEFNDLSELQMGAYEVATTTDKLVTRICGYAGTGKTTVMAQVAKYYADRCVVLAPTNKAASVLRDKDIPSAQTIHSCLYDPSEIEIYETDANGDFVMVKCEETGNMIPNVIDHKVIFNLSDKADILPPVALVDEGSMVGDDIYKDLLAVFEKIIIFGDPFQLSPVGRKEGALDLGPLDVEMKEVHRVALENPITKYATRIREGSEPRLAGNHAELIPANIEDPDLYKKIVDGEYQAICYTNRMRAMVNKKIRQEMGFEPNTLKAGEPIVCLDNIKQHVQHKDGSSGKRLLLYNGQVTSVTIDQEHTGKMLTPVQLEVQHLLDNKIDMPLAILPFWDIDWWTQWDAHVKKNSRKSTSGRLFDYSYCMTAHKAQGSEFDNVVIFDERRKMSRVPNKELQRWFYTAVTRAKKNLMVVPL